MNVTPEALEALARAHSEEDDAGFYSVLTQLIAGAVRRGELQNGLELVRGINQIRGDTVAAAVRRLRGVRVEESLEVEAQVRVARHRWGWRVVGHAHRSRSGLWQVHSSGSLHVSDVSVFVPNWPEHR